MSIPHRPSRRLGRSGLEVSLVGLGGNNFGGRLDLEGSRRVVHAALDAGITLIDTADVYGGRGGSENVLGAVLGDRRKDIVLATKFGIAMDGSGRRQGGSRRYIVEAVEASLRRLKTDWIDLYQFHRPDPNTPLEETIRALDDLVRSGKVRYVGVSNMPGWQVVEAQWLAAELGAERFISSQDEYSLLRRGVERELLPALQAKGMGLLPFYPLAGGLLSGKYALGQPLPVGARLSNPQVAVDSHLTQANLVTVGRLKAFAKERGHTLLELAFSWLAAQPVVSSVIAGASTPEQLAQNVAAVNWALTTDELAAVDEITQA